MEYLRAAHWHHFLVCLWHAQDLAMEQDPRQVVVAASRNTESLVRCWASAPHPWSPATTSPPSSIQSQCHTLLWGFSDLSVILCTWICWIRNEQVSNGITAGLVNIFFLMTTLSYWIRILKKQKTWSIMNSTVEHCLKFTVMARKSWGNCRI